MVKLKKGGVTISVPKVSAEFYLRAGYVEVKADVKQEPKQPEKKK